MTIRTFHKSEKPDQLGALLSYFWELLFKPIELYKSNILQNYSYKKPIKLYQRYKYTYLIWLLLSVRNQGRLLDIYTNPMSQHKHENRLTDLIKPVRSRIVKVKTF